MIEPDELYGLPLDRFVAERGALARQLRAQKRRDEAAAVAALRKPSVAAWAVNQLVRSQGAGVQELFDAGDALRDAQAQLLSGSGDGRALRAAGERERAAVDELVAAARGLLSSEGHELSGAVVERVDETLHAAALDEAAREQVRHGRLERELRHAGLGLGEAPATPAAPAPPGGASKMPRPATDIRHTPPKPAPRERERERERAGARQAARTAEALARRRAERAGHALKAAQERRDRAAQALAQADDALAAAQAAVDAADEALASARAELERL